MFITVTRLVDNDDTFKKHPVILNVDQIEHIPMPEEEANVKIYRKGTCPWVVQETFKELEEMLCLQKKSL